MPRNARQGKKARAGVAKQTMRPVRQHPIPSPDLEPVVLWRASRLREAGFSAQLADTLAQDCAYDLHALLNLADRGCPAALAARILAPLDDKPRPC
jgi:hypothetical protein